MLLIWLLKKTCGVKTMYTVVGFRILVELEISFEKKSHLKSG